MLFSEKYTLSFLDGSNYRDGYVGSEHHLSHSSVVSACLPTVNLAYASFYSFPQALKHQFVMRSIRSYFIWLPQLQCCSS